MATQSNGFIQEQIDTEVKKVFAYTLIGIFAYIILTSLVLYNQFDKYIFHFHIGNFYPYFLSLGVVLLAFAGFMFYRSRKLEHSSLIILTIAVFVSGFSYTIGFLNFDPTGLINFRETRYFQLQVFLETLSIILLYLHYELNSYNRPRTQFIVANILLLWPYSFLNIFYLITNSYDDSKIVENILIFSAILLQIGAILIFGWLLYNGVGIAKLFFTRTDSTKQAAEIQLSGLIILFVGTIFQMIEGSTSFSVWHTPLNTVAILLIGIPYIKNSNVMILSPVNVLVIGVIDQHGRTMYFRAIDKDFAHDEALQTTSDLFGGLTLALSSLGKEVAKSETNVDSLQFADRSIIVEYLEPYYLVVIANTSTYFLEKEMKEYLDDLKDEYPNPPQDGRVIPEEVFNRLNKKFFPIILQLDWEDTTQD